MGETAATNSNSQKIVKHVLHRNIQQNAGTRDPDTKIDDTTCFGIPGSGLPRRHCNVDIDVTILVCADSSVFISLHDGHFYQSVYGQRYICKMFVYPNNFSLNIAVGKSSWDEVEFTSNGQPVTDVRELTSGELTKGQDISNPFDWTFGAASEFEADKEYNVTEIEKSNPLVTSQYGGSGTADSKFTYVGTLQDYAWKTGLDVDVESIISTLPEAEQDYYNNLDDDDKATCGLIYLCGGIMYQSSKVTSAIVADAVPVVVLGLKTSSYYYPGDIQKDNRVSLNRDGGYLLIRKDASDKDPSYLENHGGWRDLKNTTNDAATQKSVDEAKAQLKAEGDEGGDYLRKIPSDAIQNWGFRRDNNDWVRLILTGVGGVPDGEDINGVDGGIGSDSPGSSGTGSTTCCCIEAANIIAESIAKLK